MGPRTLALVLVVAGACRGAEPATTTPESSAVPPPEAALRAPITVTAAVDQPTVEPRGRLRITITVTNTTNERRGLDFPSACATDYEFLDASGTVVASSMQMCAQALTQRALEPGGSFSDVHVWVRDLPGMPTLPPGRYQVRGVLLATGAQQRSAPVPFTVP